jgi:hypothetical protein
MAANSQMPPGFIPAVHHLLKDHRREAGWHLQVGSAFC